MTCHLDLRVLSLPYPIMMGDVSIYVMDEWCTDMPNRFIYIATLADHGN